MPRRRDLSAEAVQDLNEGLTEVRGLYVPGDKALEGLSTTLGGFKEEFQSTLANGEVSDEAPRAVDELRAAVDSLPGILEQRAAFSRAAKSFMEKLHGLITTKMDGTPFVGSIHPMFVGHDWEPERNYTGDDRDLPRIYLTSDGVEGRVVDIQGQEPNPQQVSVWVWPTGVRLGKQGDWHNGRGGSPYTTVNLLDESVEFVEHLEGCKLPKPEQFYRGHHLTFAD